MAASKTPAGMVLAGKHGLGVLSPGAIPEGGTTADLKEFWAIADETAAEHGKTMDRGQWRLGTVAHLADTKDDAIEQVRAKAGRWIRHYHERTIGREPLDVPEDKIIDHMVDTGAWCIGTPDDMIALIERLQELSGGFGSFFVQDGEMASREQTMHSYELVARYVMPRFQGSLVGRQALRDRGRPRSGGQPGEPGLHAASVAGEALVVRSRQGAFDRPRPELAEGLAPNANGAED